MRALVATLALLATAVAGRAHERSVSYASWSLDAHGATVEVRVAEYDLTRLPPESQEDTHVAAMMSRAIQLLAGDVACPPTAPPETHVAVPGWRIHTWSVDCGAMAPTAIRSTLLLDVVPTHLHLVRVTHADGRTTDHALVADAPRIVLDAAGATTFREWMRLGVEHIGSGWDHLAFVIGLIVLAPRWRDLAVLVSAFTVAHAMTLGLAALGFLRVDAPAVEALIGFSIALVGVENAWMLAGRDRGTPVLVTLAIAGSAFVLPAVPSQALLGLALFTVCHFTWLGQARHSTGLRALVAAAFGLIHGLGFAGALGVLDLPLARLSVALVGFNLGVETGQLAVVALAWPLMRLATARVGGWVPAAVSAGVAGVGVYWFVVRGAA